MANNRNLKNMRYVASDLGKQKVVAPPRNKRLEKSLYFYKTTETIVDVENSTTDSKVISATFDKEIPFKSTTPLQFDFGKPKYPALSDSQTWASQINGFIYEDIDINTDLYNFMTFSLLQDGTISKSIKYRVVDYHPFYKDGIGTFMYATIVLVRDTGNTIPGFDRISWRLSNKLIFDSKTKYIKVVLPPSTQLFPQGIKVSVENDSGTRKDTGFKVNASTDLTYKFIRIRGVSPFLFDDMTLANFQEIGLVTSGGGSTIGNVAKRGLKVWENEPPVGAIGNPDEFPDSGDSITENIMKVNLGGIDIDKTSSAVKKYFTTGAFTLSGRSESIFTQKDITPSILTSWFSGNTIFDNEPVPVDSGDLSITSGFKKISDLDEKSEEDRKYFVVTKKTDYTKAGVNIFAFRPNKEGFSGVSAYKSIGIRDEFNFQLLNKDKATKYFQEPDEEINIEIELTLSGKNVLLDLETTLADDVKISTYDDNHKLLLDSVVLDTEFKFNNAKRLTKIQL